MIQVKKARTDQEPRIHKTMMTEMNLSTLYFAPLETVVPVSWGNITKHELKKCKECAYKDGRKQFVRVTRREVGRKRLEERIEELKVNLPSSEKEKVEEYYEHIVYGLSKLREAHIVHFNIRYEDILYSDDTYGPILTEFGNAFVLEDLHDDTTRIRVFSGVKTTEQKDRCMEAKCIAKILEDAKDWKVSPVDIPALEEMITKEAEEEEEEDDGKKSWKEYVRTFGETPGEKVVNDLMRNWETWDLYSVNRIFSRIYGKTTTQEHVPCEPYAKL